MFCHLSWTRCFIERLLTVNKVNQVTALFHHKVSLSQRNFYLRQIHRPKKCSAYIRRTSVVRATIRKCVACRAVAPGHVCSRLTSVGRCVMSGRPVPKTGRRDRIVTSEPREKKRGRFRIPRARPTLQIYRIAILIDGINQWRLRLESFEISRSDDSDWVQFKRSFQSASPSFES